MSKSTKNLVAVHLQDGNHIFEFKTKKGADSFVAVCKKEGIDYVRTVER